MAIMMVHGTKWTAEFDNTLYLNLKRSAELRNCQWSCSSQTWDRDMDQQMNADEDNVVILSG